MVEPEQRKLIEKRDPRPACADLVKAVWTPHRPTRWRCWNIAVTRAMLHTHFGHMQIQLPATDFQYGRTKIFLRDKPAALLETRLAQIQALRLAKLKAEIERKRKEEEEHRAAEEARLEAERLAKYVRRQPPSQERL